MKISSFVVVTNPSERQDPWQESIASALSFSDEVVVVCGGDESGKIGKHFKDERLKLVEHRWPEKWSWDELPKHLNTGLENCTGDWAIRFDIDYVFQDDWKARLRERLSQVTDQRVATFRKLSCVLVDKFYEKGDTIMGINRNKMFEKEMKFGVGDLKTDLCVPIIPEKKEDGLYYGKLPKTVGRTDLMFFNYDYTWKTKDFVAKEFCKFSKAHERYFGSTKWGHTPEESLQVFIKMMKNRLPKCEYKIPRDVHPSFSRHKVGATEKKHFGWDMWGEVKVSR